MIHDIEDNFIQIERKKLVKKMELLLFKDDVTLTADNQVDLQKKLNTLHSHNIENELEVNRDKGKLLIRRKCNKKRGPKEE